MFGDIVELSLSNRFVSLRKSYSGAKGFFEIDRTDTYCSESPLNVSYKRLALVEKALEDNPSREDQLIECSSGSGEDAVETSKTDEKFPLAAGLRTAAGFLQSNFWIYCKDESAKTRAENKDLIGQLEIAQKLAWQLLEKSKTRIFTPEELKEDVHKRQEIYTVVVEVLNRLEDIFSKQEA